MRLDDRQEIAVNHNHGPLLVLAGAGSGKTRVLTNRIARLVNEQWAKPDEIMAVTFTNKAATEMRKRIAEVVGKNAANRMTISTFHSLGVKILREYGQYLGLKADFKIISDNERISTLKTIMRASGKTIASQNVQDFGTEISLAKNGYLQPDTYHESRPEQRRVSKVYKQYHRILLKRQSVDFDDLLMLPLKLFEEHPKVLEKFRSRYKFISIDEFQDTNTVQMKLAQYIVQPHYNLMVVGDDDQGIYSWRGAEIENILLFPRIFKGTKTVILNKNYRSTRQIVDGANGVVQKNSKRKLKDIISAAGDGEPIETYKGEDEDNEVEWIVQRIIDFHKDEHYPYEQQAILFRANAHMRRFEEELRLRRVPYFVHGSQSFFDKKEVKDIFSYLNFFANQEDELSLTRVLKVPDRGMNKHTFTALEELAINRQYILWEAFKDYKDIVGIYENQREIVQNFVEFSLRHIQKFKTSENLADCLRDLLQEIGYIDYVKRVYKAHKSLESRLEIIEEIIHSLELYENRARKREEEISLSQFLQNMSLIDNRNEEKGNGVTLMTLHKSKGLEFKVVYMPILDDTIMPSKRSLEEGNLEEERRLFYVGMTRAEQRLFLSWPNEKVMRGNAVKVKPCRFLYEIPEDCLDGKVGEKQEAEFKEMSANFFADMAQLLGDE